jgi:uncharacterized membrane protein
VPNGRENIRCDGRYRGTRRYGVCDATGIISFHCEFSESVKRYSDSSRASTSILNVLGVLGQPKMALKLGKGAKKEIKYSGNLRTYVFRVRLHEASTLVPLGCSAFLFAASYATLIRAKGCIVWTTSAAIDFAGRLTLRLAVLLIVSILQSCFNSLGTYITTTLSV